MGNYTLTDALMDDGTEAQAYLKKTEGKFETGEKVEVFFHERFNKVKFRRTAGAFPLEG